MPKSTPKPIVANGLPDYMNWVSEISGGADLVLFRGQRQQEDWELIPRIGRTKPRDGDQSIIHLESRMLSEFKLQGLPYCGRPPQDNWEWLALAQHYGLPTRLLDWTVNALAALWFAVRKPATTQSNGIVWAFVPDNGDFADTESCHNPFEINKTLVFRPAHVTPRITAQAGRFTVHFWNSTKNKFIAFELISRYKSKLHSVSVDREHFSEISSPW